MFWAAKGKVCSWPVGLLLFLNVATSNSTVHAKIRSSVCDVRVLNVNFLNGISGRANIRKSDQGGNY